MAHGTQTHAHNAHHRNIMLSSVQCRQQQERMHVFQMEIPEYIKVKVFELYCKHTTGLSVWLFARQERMIMMMMLQIYIYINADHTVSRNARAHQLLTGRSVQ